MDYITIVSGVIGGLAYSLSGLAGKDSRESFNWKKMVPTIIIAGIVGGIAGYTGQDYGFVADGAMAAGVTAVVQKLYGAVIKFLTKK